MKILEVTDPEFKEYGKLLEGLDTSNLIDAMNAIPYEEGVSYEASIDSLEADKVTFSRIENSVYGGMPIQIGMCWAMS